MNNFLKYKFIEFDTFSISVSNAILFIVFILAIIALLHLAKKISLGTKRIAPGKRYAIYNLIKYAVLISAGIIGLQILGFNLSVLLAGSAALLVGVGLGLQNLFSDFISGIILLIDSSIKVDDVIEVNGVVSTVQEINLRTTLVKTRADKYIILPNSELTRNQVINWTRYSIASRFEVTVGVDYSSDVSMVMEVLKETVINHEGVLKEPDPIVQFVNYGESSLDFAIYFWSEEVFRVENIKSEIRVRIFEAFAAHGILIPFPQRVIHLQPDNSITPTTP